MRELDNRQSNVPQFDLRIHATRFLMPKEPQIQVPRGGSLQLK